MPSAAIVSRVGVLNSFLRVTCLPFLSCCVQLTLISPQPMSSTRTKIMLGLAPETCAGMSGFSATSVCSVSQPDAAS